MPFDRPDLDALRLRVRQDLMSRLPGTDAMLRFTNLRIIADVEAGIAWLLYGRLQWSFDQLFPDTAESEFLDRWAGIWGVERRPATPAAGPVRFAANPGASVPAGTIVQRGDGVQFQVLVGVSEAGGIIDTAVVATTPGADTDTDAGTELTVNTTVPGVSATAVVIPDGLVGGADVEPDDQLRARLLARIQAPPHGGTADDYVMWAMEVPGVTRAWCFPTEFGPGTVVVRFMMDVVRADAQGIPTAGDVALVQEYIEALKPVTAQLFVLAPVALPMDVTINGLIQDTPPTRTDINAELLDMLVREAMPGGEIYPSQVIGAINAAPLVEKFRLVAPAASVLPDANHIVTLGTVTYT
jgi:uncharacterized phage protein gp47/JayE